MNENGTAPTPAGGRSSSRRSTHLLHQMLVIFLITYIVLTRETSQLNDYKEKVRDSELNSQQPQSHRKPRLGDGCYHVFLDVGANIGVHGRFLLEPHKYLDSWHSVSLFQKEYPGLDNRDICIFAFEANPKHWPRLKQVSKAYASVGWRYNVVEAAVSDVAGSTTFYHQGINDENNEEWGFSGAKDLSNIYGAEKSKGKYTEEVTTIRLSDWIRTHVYERLVPEIPPSRRESSGEGAMPRPILSMKMDIEGYEYVVMPDLIHAGTVCNFTFIFGEFHPNFAPITSFRNEDENKNDGDGGLDRYHRIPLETEKDAMEYGWALTKVLESSRHCPVRFLSIDDESYLHDGQPLPSAATDGR